MKKIFTLLAFLVVISTSIAKEKSSPTEVHVYGVDFTAVTVIDAAESDANFLSAFEGINDLILIEQKKYDIAKYLKVVVKSIDCEFAKKRVKKLEDARFKNRTVPTLNLEEIVSHYPTTPDYGLIIVAKELNKPKNMGHFIAVIYDGKTKKIISTYELSGKAKGFGLRNFWAGSLFKGLKNVK